MEHKIEGKKSKMELGDFNCTMDKMGRYCENKTERLYRCGFNYALSKLIVFQRLDYPMRRKNPDTSEFTRYDRSSGTRSRIDRVYTDIKVPNNTNINHKIVSFTDYYNAISLDRIPSKIKTGKDLWYFNISLLF